MDTRYAPCYILYKHNVAYTCWFEDAVAHYGVPTVLFDLYLLVKDIHIAAKVLLDNGWAEAEGRSNDVFCFHSSKECKPYRRLVHPAFPDTHTFLMNAADWGFSTKLLDNGQLESCSDRANTQSSPVYFPRLCDLMDALIDSMLDLDPEDDGEMVSGKLVMMLGYLYQYVPILKNDTYADQLAYDHRQLHYDIKAIYCYSLRFIRHERKVRQKIRENKLVPSYDPWNNDRECVS